MYSGFNAEAYSTEFKKQPHFQHPVIGLITEWVNENGEIETGGIESQTRRTMENVKKVLALAGCDLADVVKVSVWLDDTRDFWTFNRIYTEYFGDNPPARSCVQSAMMVDCKVEIEVTAYKPL